MTVTSNAETISASKLQYQWIGPAAVILVGDGFGQKKQQQIGEAGNGAKEPFHHRQRDDAGQDDDQAGKKTGAPARKKRFSHARILAVRDNCANEIFCGQAAHQPVFLALHPAARRRLQIVMAQQMQNAVDNVTHDFRLPGGAKPLRLQNRLVHADEQFAVQVLIPASRLPRSGFLMIERDDIRRTFVLQKGFIEQGHFAGADQVDAQFTPSTRSNSASSAVDDLP